MSAQETERGCPPFTAEVVVGLGTATLIEAAGPFDYTNVDNALQRILSINLKSGLKDTDVDAVRRALALEEGDVLNDRLGASHLFNIITNGLEQLVKSGQIDPSEDEANILEDVFWSAKRTKKKPFVVEYTKLRETDRKYASDVLCYYAIVGARYMNQQANSLNPYIGDIPSARSGRVSNNALVRRVNEDKSKLPWMAQGNCAGVSPDMFFPSDGVGVKIAKQICLDCPSTEVCLEYALSNRIEHGVWGGASERQRRKILKARREAAKAHKSDIATS